MSITFSILPEKRLNDLSGIGVNQVEDEGIGLRF